MKIAISAEGPSLDSMIDPRFGRCAYFIIIDTDSYSFEAMENPNITLGGGAGIQSGQMMADKGVQALITGNCGPNAHKVLSAAGVDIITGASGLVSDAVEDFKAGKFAPTSEPNVEAHFDPSAGAGQATGSQAGIGMGGGRGMGGGGGRGMGGGGGRGMGGGGGRGMGGGGGRGKGGGRGGRGGGMGSGGGRGR
jgi:predicted Fe-Mo cluster-binding NifX family protein